MGRHREMSALQAALDDARSGRGQIVMLVGEPGIGKTSTVREFTDHAVSQGAQVAWGRCYESNGMPSYWPWVQAIRSYVREQDPEQLRLEMGTGAGEIAEIVPDVRERLPGLEPSPGLESLEHARLRLFDSVTSFLERASLTGHWSSFLIICTGPTGHLFCCWSSCPRRSVVANCLWLAHIGTRKFPKNILCSIHWVN